MAVCGWCGEGHTEAEGMQGGCYDCQEEFSCAESLKRGNAAKDGLSRCDDCQRAEDAAHAKDAATDNHMEKAKEARTDERYLPFALNTN